MPVLTINLSEEAKAALHQTATARGSSIDRVVQESLEVAGVLPNREASRLVDRARRNANLSEAEALEIAVAETRAARRERRS